MVTEKEAWSILKKEFDDNDMKDFKIINEHLSPVSSLETTDFEKYCRNPNDFAIDYETGELIEIGDKDEH